MFYVCFIHTSPQFNYLSITLTRGGNVKGYYPNWFCRAVSWFNLVWPDVLTCTRSCGSHCATVQRMILTDILGASARVFTSTQGRFLHWGREGHVLLTFQNPIYVPPPQWTYLLKISINKVFLLSSQHPSAERREELIKMLICSSRSLSVVTAIKLYEQKRANERLPLPRGLFL